jgi:hypothetical protein
MNNRHVDITRPTPEGAAPTVQRIDYLVKLARGRQETANFAKRHDTSRGQQALQHLHDTATYHGAVCTRGSSSASMASRHEADAIQAIHDTAVEHGASCDEIPSLGPGALGNLPATMPENGPAMYSGAPAGFVPPAPDGAQPSAARIAYLVGLAGNTEP